MDEMTESSRLHKIEAMLADDPSDQFLQYALAMELGKAERHEESLDRLGQLMRGSPPMIAAFFMGGQQLAKLGRIDASRTVLREGIEQARTQNESHAAAEMSEFLISLGELGE